MSGGFQKVVYAMIETEHRLIQTDLFGHEVELKVVWVFIGIFPADKLGITRNEWRKTITDSAILNEILIWITNYVYKYIPDRNDVN